MKVIIDAGGTKVDWLLLVDDTVVRLRQKGFNPFTHDIYEWLEDSRSLVAAHAPKFIEVYYYGAGIQEETRPVILYHLTRLFDGCHVEVNNDLLAVARGMAHDRPGQVGILGTGSAGAYYDGHALGRQVPSLGYLLGDEGSGAALGRLWLQLGFRNQLPPQAQLDFSAQHLSFDQVVERLYQGEAVNTYLAQYASCWEKYPEDEVAGQILRRHFKDFFEAYYPEGAQGPSWLVGSVAYFFQKHVKRAAGDLSFHSVTIQQSPMEGLIAYHQKNG